jgi:hypothetical protein
VIERVDNERDSVPIKIPRRSSNHRFLTLIFKAFSNSNAQKGLCHTLFKQANSFDLSVTDKRHIQLQSNRSAAEDELTRIPTQLIAISF